MWLERTKRGFEVVDVVAGGAAAEAGLKAGDVLVAIDGKLTSARRLPDARTWLKVAEGTRVRLSIARSKRELELKLRNLVELRDDLGGSRSSTNMNRAVRRGGPAQRGRTTNF